MIRIGYVVRWKYIFFIAGILLMFLPAEGFAFRIDKGTIRVQLSPGEKYNATVVVDNPTERETLIKVYINDFLYISPFNGDKEFFPPESTRFSLSEWVTFSLREFIIPPFSSRSVNIFIEPRGSFDTVRCGVVFFESTIGVTYQGGEEVNVLGRIGSLLFIEPVNQNKNISFDDIKGGVHKINGMIQNNGNTFLHTEGTFFVMDSEGMVSDRGQINEAYLLPGDQTDLNIDVVKNLAPGRYINVVTFDLGDGNVAVKEIDFYVSAAGNIEIFSVCD